METIRTSSLRVGNFTSSEIHKLMSVGKRPMTQEELDARPKKGKGSKSEYVEDGPGEAFYSYVQEKKMERLLGRPLNDDVSARPLEWGKLVEAYAFLQLGFDYTPTSRNTVIHPVIDSWSGTPDGESEDAVIEVKCPFTLKSFCELYSCATIGEVRERHKQGEAYYWQLLSNAILTGKRFAELVVFMPYQSELSEIRQSIEVYDGDPNKVAWIHFAQDHDLPYLVDGGYYKHLHKIRFEVPEQDKLRLTKRVELAARLLK